MLDQNLERYIRAQDPNGAIKKIPAFQHFVVKDPATAHHENEPNEDDEEDQEEKLANWKLEIELKQFDTRLKKETALFESWLNFRTAHMNREQTARLKWNTQATELLNSAVNTAIEQAWTVHTEHSIPDGEAKSAVALRSACDFFSMPVEKVYKVYVINGTYMNAQGDGDVEMLTKHISTSVLSDAKYSAYIFIGPSQGLRPFSAHLHGERIALQTYESHLKEATMGCEVGGFNAFMNPKGRYSAETPCAKQCLIVFSNQKDASGKFISKWAKSALYRSEAVLDFCDFNPRANFVDPAKSLLEGNKVASGSAALESKQTHSGVAFWLPLLKTLLKDVGATAQSLVHFRINEDLDASFSEACLQLMAYPPQRGAIPILTTSSLVTQGNKTQVQNTEVFIKNVLGHALKDRSLIVVWSFEVAV